MSPQRCIIITCASGERRMVQHRDESESTRCNHTQSIHRQRKSLQTNTPPPTTTTSTQPKNTNRNSNSSSNSSRKTIQGGGGGSDLTPTLSSCVVRVFGLFSLMLWQQDTDTHTHTPNWQMTIRTYVHPNISRGVLGAVTVQRRSY